MQLAQQQQAALGQGVGGFLGTLGSAALLANPATAGLSPANTLLQQQNMPNLNDRYGFQSTLKRGFQAPNLFS